MSYTRREFVRLGAALGAGMMVPLEMVDRALAFSATAQGIAADPTALQKWVSDLPVPSFMPQAAPNYYKVGAYQFRSLVHPSMRPTTVWGYRPVGYRFGRAPEPTWLGPSFAIRRGTRTKVEWQNRLTYASGTPLPHPLPVDPSIMWADPFGDSPPMGYEYPVTTDESTYNYSLAAVPLVTHVHGGEQPSAADGHHSAWATPNSAAVPAKTGPQWDLVGDVTGSSWDAAPSGAHNVYPYYNEQLPATIWYHDHALGLDRLNVYMGLAGAYVIWDPDLEPAGLPSVTDGKTDAFGHAYDIPLVIQDRIFDLNGQLLYPADSDNPTIHPYWIPEFFGDTICVNGKAWPRLKVEGRKYRFRILNGSNARFYRLRLWDNGRNRPGPKMQVVATDGGYLGSPAIVDFAADDRLVMGPGERYEVVVDFSGWRGGQLTLMNDAPTPYPDGDPVVAGTTDRVMKFRVAHDRFRDRSIVPVTLAMGFETYPSLADDPAVTRLITLNEIEGPGGPLEAVLNNTAFDAPVTETPVLGSTEVWALVNLTMDAHPIHHHLAQAQILRRQTFDMDAYTTAYNAAFPGGPMPDMPMGPPLPYDEPGTELPDGSKLIGGNPDVAPYLTGNAEEPASYEKGWKDTTVCPPGYVTWFKVKWSSNSGEEFPFDATAGPGYVWHCHILEHEENDMMRPLVPKAEE